MKKFKLILALAMMAMVMPCPAQSNMGTQQFPTKKANVTEFKFYELPGVKNLCEVVVPNGYEKVTQNCATTFVEKQNEAVHSRHIAPKEGEINVKCEFDCDMKEWRPILVCAYNKNNSDQFAYKETNNFGTLKLQSGSYDFIAIFTKVEPTSINGFSYRAYVIKEDVQVTGETTLTFDPNTATNQISMRSYNPNGDATTLSCIKYIDNNYNYETIKEGNVYDVKVIKTIHHEDYGEIYFLSSQLGGGDVELNSDYPQLGQWKAEEWAGDFYVNDVSDKYMFQQFRIILSDDKTFSTVIRAKGGKTQFATNDYTKYGTPIEYKFINTPANKKYGADFENGDYGLNYFYSYNKETPMYTIGLFSQTNAIHNIQFCPSSTLSEYDNNFDFGFSFYHIDACKNDTTTNFFGNQTIMRNGYSVNSQNIFPKSTGNEYVYSANQTWLETPKVGELQYALPGPEGIKFDFSQTDIAACSTCPIATTYYLDLGGFPIMETIYKGQLGEIRQVDNIDATIELKSGEETIATTFDELNEWMNTDITNPAKLTLSMTNRNFEVEGIAGGNEMVCSVDQNMEDCYSPTLTALQFRKADGFVTNRFENADDATMAIMCGDFNEHTNKGRIWFELSDCDVTVEYAPNGTNEFTVIDMVKEDDKSFMPGYGAYYCANLGDITNPSSNKWYDLRITLMDDAGNYQQQTISPAFRIGNIQSGIGNVKVGNATEVARYTVDGRAISAPQAGVNIVKMSDGSVKKVWVK